MPPLPTAKSKIYFMSGDSLSVLETWDQIGPQSPSVPPIPWSPSSVVHAPDGTVHHVFISRIERIETL